MRMNKSKIALATGLLFAATVALAQTSYVRPAYQFPASPATAGPAALTLGDSGFFVTPYL